MANIGVTENSGFIPEIWLGTALGRLMNYLTIVPTITVLDDLPTGSTFSAGQTVHIPKRGVLNVNMKSDTGNYVVQNPQSDTVDISLQYQPEVSFGISSQALAFQNQDVILGYVEDAVIALAEQVDSIILNSYHLIPAGQIVGSGLAITASNILSARKILQDNKAPANAQKFGIVSTLQEQSILLIDQLVRYDSIGVANNVTNASIGAGRGASVIPGATGRAYGFEIAPSQLITSVATNANDIQTVTIGGAPTGGSFTLTLNGTTTTSLPYNATAKQVQAALSGVSGYKGYVYVTLAGAVYTVNLLAGVGAVTAAGSFTGGTTPTVTVAQAVQTVGSRNLFYTKDWLCMATRPLPLPPPGSGALGTYMVDPRSGIGMRLVQSWNNTTGSPQISLDLLMGFNAMRPEHGVCIINS